MLTPDSLASPGVFATDLTGEIVACQQRHADGDTSIDSRILVQQHPRMGNFAYIRIGDLSLIYLATKRGTRLRARWGGYTFTTWKEDTNAFLIQSVWAPLPSDESLVAFKLRLINGC